MAVAALSLAACSDEPSPEAAPSTTATTEASTTTRRPRPSSSTTTSTTPSTAPSRPAEEPAEPSPDENIVEEVSADTAFADVDPGDPAAVATAWGHAYHTQPAGETQAAWVARLAPLAGPDLVAVLGELRYQPPATEITIVPGLVEMVDDTTYTVRGNTIPIDAQGAPAGATTTYALTVTVEDVLGQWRVVCITFSSGLTYP